MLTKQDSRLVFQYDGETLWIEAWGKDAFRIRATKQNRIPSEDWALLSIESPLPIITIGDEGASIVNGSIKAEVTTFGKITITNSAGDVLLKERSHNRIDFYEPTSSAMEIYPRQHRPILGTEKYHVTTRFESLSSDEKIYGMGQYQQPLLNLKGADLELAHRNSQISIPFAVSSLGYGLLWNNPAIGRASFATNGMTFEAYSTQSIDYWITAGDAPAQIVENYANVTGKAPMMPDYGLGMWQCKLRYQTQDELLQVAREHVRRQIPIDVIAVDFFHWEKQGNWSFDSTYWPDPEKMIKEINDMGIEVMVSVWPTVQSDSVNYKEMVQKGYLIRADRGVRVSQIFLNGITTMFADSTNPEARQFVWDKLKQNYYDKGIKVFWMDENEPEFTNYDFDNYRYWLGPNLSIGNIYPREHGRLFYEGQKAAGLENPLNLSRCAWAGSQKYGMLIWSGDVPATWTAFRNQLSAGLNIGLAGIPWWTMDIGGFLGGDPNDPAYQELFCRWFQFGTFCPVMRMHGARLPEQPQHGTTGGAICRSGAPNEIWSYGNEVYEICKEHISIRETLRPYTKQLMLAAHERGTPVIRTLFYEFPKDKMCWEICDQYMYGDKYLCCPVFNAGQMKRSVYLPSGSKWRKFGGPEVYEGGQTIEVDAPLKTMPVFERQRVNELVD
ncbi:hypothetical protein LTS17_005278 [Exophiala oligosperma]